MTRARRFLIKLLVLLPLTFVAVTVLWVAALKVINPPFTPLMVRRAIEFRGEDGFRTRHRWVPLDKISPNMIKAVMSSEDNLFDQHNGFDTKAIKQAIDERKAGRRQRGGSTISQQTAKNVFTRGKSTWVRKGFEAYFTVLIEKIWGKERIMEVYLNMIEMGKGIYGVGAAADVYFGKKAADLTLGESCLIAVCLPNPLKMHPDKPSSYVLKRQKAIISLSRKLSYPEWVE